MAEPSQAWQTILEEVKNTYSYRQNPTPGLLRRCINEARDIYYARTSQPYTKRDSLNQYDERRRATESISDYVQPVEPDTQIVIDNIMALELPDVTLELVHDSEVMEYFYRYHPSFRVEAIISVQNRMHQREFAEMEARLRSTNGGDSNTQILYHATKAHPAEIIKTRLKLSAGGFFGAGIYFTESPLKANDYSIGRGYNPKALRYILKCRVALGRVADFEEGHNRELRAAPSGFNSVRGHVRRDHEFVVYTPQQVLLEQVILYSFSDVTFENAVIRSPAALRCNAKFLTACLSKVSVNNRDSVRSMWDNVVQRLVSLDVFIDYVGSITGGTWIQEQRPYLMLLLTMLHQTPSHSTIPTTRYVPRSTAIAPAPVPAPARSPSPPMPIQRSIACSSSPPPLQRSITAVQDLSFMDRSGSVSPGVPGRSVSVQRTSPTPHSLRPDRSGSVGVPERSVSVQPASPHNFWIERSVSVQRTSPTPHGFRPDRSGSVGVPERSVSVQPTPHGVRPDRSGLDRPAPYFIPVGSAVQPTPDVSPARPGLVWPTRSVSVRPPPAPSPAPSPSPELTMERSVARSHSPMVTRVRTKRRLSQLPQQQQQRQQEQQQRQQQQEQQQRS